MRSGHYYYYCLYNSFYKDGFSLQNKTYSSLSPEERPPFLLAMSTYLSTIFIRLLVIYIFNPLNKIFFFGYYEIAILSAAWIIYYFYFVDSQRYIEIYSQYKLTDKVTRKRDSIKVWIAVISPLPLTISLALLMTYSFHINLHQYI